MAGRHLIFAASALGKYYAKNIGKSEGSLRCSLGVDGGFYLKSGLSCCESNWK